MNDQRAIAFDLSDPVQMDAWATAELMLRFTPEQSKEARGYVDDVRHGRKPGEYALVFHEKLALAIKNNGMTQEALARAVGISSNQLSRIVRGRADCSTPLADKLEDALGVPRRSLWSDKMRSFDLQRRQRAAEHAAENATWGTKIRDRRKELGMTQFQLADLSGVSQAQISNMERSVHRPHSKYFEYLKGPLQLDNINQLNPELKDG